MIRASTRDATPQRTRGASGLSHPLGIQTRPKHVCEPNMHDDRFLRANSVETPTKLETRRDHATPLPGPYGAGVCPSEGVVSSHYSRAVVASTRAFVCLVALSQSEKPVAETKLGQEDRQTDTVPSDTCMYARTRVPRTGVAHARLALERSNGASPAMRAHACAQTFFSERPPTVKW